MIAAQLEAARSGSAVALSAITKPQQVVALKNSVSETSSETAVSLAYFKRQKGPFHNSTQCIIYKAAIPLRNVTAPHCRSTSVLM